MKNGSQNHEPETRLHFAALSVVCLVGGLLRLSYMDLPARYDEAVTFLRFVLQPLGYSLSHYPLPNNHLFYTLQARSMYLLFDDGLWVVRTPAFIAGVLIIPFTYLLIRRLYNVNAALLAAAAVAVSPSLAAYSANARGYSLVVLLGLWLFIICARILRVPRKADWTALVIVSALGMYTIPVMLYPIGCAFTWLVLSIFLGGAQRPVGPLLVRVALSGLACLVLTLLLYLPVFMVSGVDAVTSNTFVRSLDYASLASTIAERGLAAWRLFNSGYPGILQLFILGCFGLSLIRHSRLSGYKLNPVLTTLLWIALFTLLRRVFGFDRVWLFLLPLYLGMAASGFLIMLDRLDPWVRAYKHYICAGLAIVWALSFGMFEHINRAAAYSDDSMPDAEEITLTLEVFLMPGITVYAPNPADGILWYYFHQHNLSSDYIFNKPNGIDSLYLVVDGRVNHIDQVLAIAQGDYSFDNQPQLLKRFEHGASLWGIFPKGPLRLKDDGAARP